MGDVTETQLPGVGVRYEFESKDGDRVGVVCHATGRREIVVYDDADPDMARSVIGLDAKDARTLSDCLGATQVTESIGAIQHQIEGLSFEWVEIGQASSLANRSLESSNLREQTGASVVAVIRGDLTEPAPSPTFELLAGDTAVAVGTRGPRTTSNARSRVTDTLFLGAAGGDAAIAFIEIGAVAIALAVLARLAARLGITAIPLYLVAGLAVGEGGLFPLDVSEDFISLAAQIGVLLLLFTLGLEYTGAELRTGLRTGAVAGAVDAVANFSPGFAAGLLLGWDATTAALLGGVTWISSSGVIAKVLADLHRLGNRETPSILNTLVIEDLAMAVYLPIMGALIADQSPLDTATTVAVALVAVTIILVVALRYGDKLSQMLEPGTDEALLLAVFGLTLLVGGLAEELNVSSAIGAFLVGLALSGSVQERAADLIAPLRDLFAAVFFLFFSFQIDPATLVDAALPALGLTVVTSATKVLSGWVAAARNGVGRPGRIRAGTALIARGEFSIVIAALGAGAADAEELGALAAAYVLLTAIVGPVAARYAHLVPVGSTKKVLT